MLKTRVAAVTALVVAMPAQAAIVAEQSGQTDATGFFFNLITATAPGSYKLTYSFDIDTSAFRSDALVHRSYDFICPGSPPTVCGGNSSDDVLSYTRIDARTYVATFALLPEYTQPGGFGPPGTYTRFNPDVFRGGASEATDAIPYSEDHLPTPFGYRIVLESVPEPGSWALMIAGFGLAGAALRRRATPALA